MRRVLIPNEDVGPALSNPDVTQTTTEEVGTQAEAEALGSEYLPFVDAAYTGAGNPESGQAELDKHVQGWTYQDALSTPENQVFYHDTDSDAVIVAPGTRGISDALATWADIMSEEQSAVAGAAGSVAARFFPGVAAAGTGAYNFAKTFSPSQGADERIDSMHGMIHLVREERGTDANILLLGHSLGGYVTRMTARETGLSSIVYNSAVGKSRVYRGNTSKNVELRIRGDVVSGTPWAKHREWTINRGIRDPLSAHRTEQFARDPAFYLSVRSGEVTLQREGRIKEREYFRPFTRKTVENPSVHRDFVDRTCKPGYRLVDGVCVRF
jgi:fermentation-respiration switch protein FrsA (DUF1100 family)